MNMKIFENDWRNMGQIDYLYRKRLKFVTYSKEFGDHEHCEFCSEKISNLPNSLNCGYYTVNTKYRYWICPKCYEDFKDIFQWSLEK